MPHDTGLGTAETSPGPATLGTVFKKTFPSDFRWVRRSIQHAISALESQGLSAEHLGSVEIVLAEALNNIVEHSYDETEPGDVHLHIRRRNSGLLFEIHDNGSPMPSGRAPLGHHSTSPNDTNLSEGGYGWILIRELVRDLIYDRRDGQNILIFRMAFTS